MGETVTGAFSIVPSPWIVPGDGSAETKHTTAWMRITVGDRVVTRVDDRWSQSARDQVVLSAYPLAQWFASSWWRLLWEPSPELGRSPTLGWRMAHETAAVGHGYAWPRLRFVSDGETIEVTSRPSPHAETEPVRYLEDSRVVLPLDRFQVDLEEFQSLVVRRLQVTGPRETEFGKLWEAVRAERADPAKASWRRIEARLGFDPDEAPEALVDRFRDLGSLAGQDGGEEIATACGGRSTPGALLEEVIEAGRSGGVRGRFASLPRLHVDAQLPPWSRGRSLAELARKALSLGNTPISDDAISDLLGISSRHLRVDQPASRLPVGLAIREEGEQFSLVLRKRHPEARRFEAARFLAEGLLAPHSERWLPETDANTARQKVQRSFAAEFLAPIAVLRERLQGDFREEAIEDAAASFGVSPLLVRSHLANNGLVSPEAV